MLEELIAWVSPRTAYSRAAWRQGFESLKNLKGRGYAAAERGRLNADWSARAGSGDAHLVPDLATLRARSEQMCRDNPHAKSALRNLTAHVVGDGIKARALHEKDAIAKQAQQIWLDWAMSPVDGRHNFAQVQKLDVRTMIRGGEVLHLWLADGNVPDAKIRVLDGAFLDPFQQRLLNDGGRIVSGVELDKGNQRAAYWLFPQHPNDVLGSFNFQSNRIDAKYVDHIFESEWGGQIRGEPWFHAGLKRLRDNEELNEAIQIKKRVEACLAIIRRPGSDGSDDPRKIGTTKKQTDGKTWEELTPGMVVTSEPGEEITVVDPSSSDGADAHQRAQMQAVAAAFGVPFHLLTGDVSQANYSSLRAAMVAFWALLDDWQSNTIIPFICEPAFKRQMARAAIQFKEPRLLEVRAHWTAPPRAWVDPLKDITAEILGIRAGLDSLPAALASRGYDWHEFFQQAADVNAEIDALRLAFDTDPRRTNAQGSLQPPAGYLGPKPASPGSKSADATAADFIIEMGEAELAGDAQRAERMLFSAIQVLFDGGRSQAAAALRAIYSKD